MVRKLWTPAGNKTFGSTHIASVGVFVPISCVFPECTPSTEELKCQLSSLSRTDALLWCARLNLVISNATHQSSLVRQRFGIQQFLTHEQIRRVANFYGSREKPDTTLVFFRHQILELMQWIAAFCDDFENDGTTFEDLSVRQTFAKSLLLAGEIWGERNYTGKLDPGIHDVNELRRRSLGAARIGTEAANAGIDPILAIGRGHDLFVHHMECIRPNFKTEFENSLGLEIEQFYGLLASIAWHFLVRSPNEGGTAPASTGLFRATDLLRVAEELGQAFAKYADHFCFSPHEFAIAVRASLDENGIPGCWNSLKLLQKRPILRTDDGRCIVADPVFFSEHASVGPLFEILSQCNVNKCFEDFGHAFERYVGGILQTMYPQAPPPLTNRLTLNVCGESVSGKQVQIADAHLIDSSADVLFEIKTSWVGHEHAEKSNPNAYLDIIREKYAKPDRDGAPKGAGQLARSISKIATGEWAADGPQLCESSTIFPVLICYDPMLGSATHPWFLAEEFSKTLEPDGTQRPGIFLKGHLRVANLIVISVDFLECLEASIDNFSFAELLNDYSTACPDRVIGLRSYVTTSKYGRRLFASRGLARNAALALEKACKMSGLRADA